MRRVEKLVFSADRTSDDFCLEIITGVGDIRTGVLKLLNQNGYIWHHPGTNTGTVIITE